jgi:hypothetical protein
VLLPLQTREQLSSAKHKAKTLSYTFTTRATQTIREVIEIPDAPSVTARHLTTPQRPEMPPGFQPFSPSPPPTARSGSSTRPPANRRLELEEILPAPSATAPIPICRYNPLTATLYTKEGRADPEADDIFLNCCRLASHHSTRFHLMEIGTGHPVLSDSHIFVREPCRLFRTEILHPLQKNATSTAFLTPFQSFMEHLLRPARIDLVSVGNPNFFSGELLHSLLLVESWMVSPHLQPT